LFDTARAEAAARLLAARQFLGLVPPIEHGKPTEAAICKGLVFVYSYGAYEYVVRSLVRVALSRIRSEGLAPKELRREILSLALDPLMLAAAGAGRRRLWQCRVELLSGCESTTPLAAINDTAFPSDGSHYRPAQLRTIWRIFGITAPIVPSPKHLGRIEELVENRNAISHGRSTPEEVGRRYSVADLETRIDDCRDIATHLLETMQRHCDSGGLHR
jgi:hypothetical protein